MFPLNQRDANLAGQMRAYQKAQDWPRLVKLLKDRYGKAFYQELRSAAQIDARLQAPIELRQLARLGFDLIVSEDIGRLAVDIARQPAIRTWRDDPLLPNADGKHRQTLLFPHGHCWDSESLVLSLEEIAHWRKEAMHPFAARLEKAIGTRPVLILNPVGHQGLPELLQYCASIPAERIFQWRPAENDLYRKNYSWLKPFSMALASQLGRPLELERKPHEQPRTSWIPANSLLNLKPPKKEEIRSYYRGGRLNWELVGGGYTIPRREVAKLQQLIADGASSLLLTGPSGEGKSTALMQLALVLNRQGYTLLFVRSSLAETLPLLTNIQGKLALFIDDAANMSGLGHLVNKAKLRKGTLVIMAARGTDWEFRQGRGEAILRGHTQVKMERLNRGEIGKLAQLLSQSGIRANLQVSQLEEKLANKQQQRFLLAAMLEACGDSSLQDILKDVVERIAQQSNGPLLLQILGAIVAIETLPTRKENTYLLPIQLLTELLELEVAEIQELIGQIADELQPQQVFDRVRSRDPIIARDLHTILFKGTPIAPLDEGAFYNKLACAAAYARLKGEKAIKGEWLSLLPKHFIESDRLPIAAEILEDLIEIENRNSYLFQMLGVVTTKMIEGQQSKDWERARNFFRRALDLDPNHASALQAWALLEREFGNIGEIVLPFSARWLLHRAVLMDPQHIPSWHAWAVLERDCGNFGQKDVPYSARWLFLNALSVDLTNEPTWRAWIEMEWAQNEPERANELLAEANYHVPDAHFIDLEKRLKTEPPLRLQPTTKPGDPIQEDPLYQWLKRLRDAGKLSEYSCYLFAKAVASRAREQLNPRLVFVAMASILEHLHRPLLRETRLCRIKGTPLTGKMMLEKDRPASSLFLATVEGGLYQIQLVAAPKCDDSRLPEEVQVTPIHEADNSPTEQPQSIGLYALPGPFSSSLGDLLLVQRMDDGAFQGLRFAINSLERAPHIEAELPDWMKICPIEGPPGEHLVRSYRGQVPELEATAAYWWHERLWQSKRFPTAEQAFQGISLSVIGSSSARPQLLVVHPDQYITSYEIQEDPGISPQRAWQWFSRRQPRMLLEIPQAEEASTPRILLAYEDGDLYPAHVLGSAWGSDLWQQLLARLAELRLLAHPAEWKLWLEEMQRDLGLLQHNLRVKEALIQKLIVDKLLAVENFEETDFESCKELFQLHLGTEKSKPMLRSLREKIQAWAKGDDFTGASFFLQLYRHLQYAQQDIIDSEFEKLKEEMSSKIPDDNDTSKDAIAYKKLMPYFRKTRQELLLESTTPITSRVSLMADIFVKNSCLSYTHRCNQGERGFLRTIMGTSYLVWFSDKHIYQIHGQVHEDVTPEGWFSPRLVIQLKQDLAVPKLMAIDHQSIALFGDVEGRLMRESQYKFTGGRLVKASDAGAGKAFLLIIPDGATDMIYELWLWDVKAARKIACQKISRHAGEELLTHQLASGEKWLLLCGYGKEELLKTTVVICGEELQFQDSKHTKVMNGRVRSLALIETAEGFDLLIGTTSGFLQSRRFDKGGNWTHMTWVRWLGSAIRYLDVSRLNGSSEEYRTLAMTTLGELVLLDQAGNQEWRRQLHTTFRSGALYGNRDQDYPELMGARTGLACGAIDVRGVLETYPNMQGSTLWKPLQEQLTLFKQLKERDVRHDEILALSALDEEDSFPKAFLSRRWSSNARALLLKAFVQKCIPQLELSQLSEWWQELEPVFTYSDLENLALIDSSALSTDRKVALWCLCVRRLSKMMVEQKLVGRVLKMRWKRTLIDLIVGMGGEFATADWLATEQTWLWQGIPDEFRCAEEVYIAVFSNTLKRKRYKDWLELKQLTAYLGPKAFAVLPQLVTEQDLVIAERISNAVLTIEQMGSTASITPDMTGEQGREFKNPPLALALFRMLLAQDRTWDEVVELACEFQIQEIRGEGPWSTLRRMLARWLRPFALPKSNFEKPLAEQLNQVQILEHEVAELPPNLLKDWQPWTQNLRALFQGRCRELLKRRREELQSTCRVRPALFELERLGEEKIRLQLKLQREGAPGPETRVRICLLEPAKPIGTFANLGHFMGWDQVVEQKQSIICLVEDLAELSLQIETQQEQGKVLREVWHKRIPPKAPHNPKLLESAPAWSNLLSKHLDKRRGFHLLACDEALGIETLTSLWHESGFHFVNLDQNWTSSFQQTSRFAADFESLLNAMSIEKRGQDWIAKSPEASSGMVLYPGSGFYQKLVDPRNKVFLEKFMEVLSRLKGYPIYLLLPIAEACRLQRLLNPHAELIPLYLLDLDKSQWEVGLSQVAADCGKAPALLAQALEIFAGNLHLFNGWLHQEKSATNFICESAVADRLIRDELTGLTALDMANFIILAHAKVKQTRKWIRPDMVAAQPPEGEAAPHDISWVYGYQIRDRQSEIMSLDGEWRELKELGGSDSYENRRFCRGHLKQRSVLNKSGMMYYLRLPYWLWVQSSVANLDQAQALIERTVGISILESVPLDALDKACASSERFMPRISTTTRTALRALVRALDNSVAENWRSFFQMLVGEEYRLKSSGISAEQRAQLQEFAPGEQPLFYYFEHSANQKGLILGKSANAHLNFEAWHSRWLKAFGNRTNVVFFHFAADKTPPFQECLCILSESHMRALLSAAHLSSDFHRLLRYRFPISQLSPFKVGGPLDSNSPAFVGRKKELETILANIESQSFLVIGARQMGKTSLLRKVFHELSRRSHLRLIWTDAQGIKSAEDYLPEFERGLGQALPASERPAEERLERALRDNAPSVLFINEIDGLAEEAIPFLMRLRALSEMGLCQCLMVGYQGAYGGINSPQHPIFHWTHGMEAGEKVLILGQLEVDAANSLIDLLETSELQLRWESDETRYWGRALLIERSYRIPLMLQLACQSLVEALARSNRLVIRKSDFEQVLQGEHYPVWDYLDKIQPYLRPNKALSTDVRADSPRNWYSAFYKLVIKLAARALYFPDATIRIPEEILELEPEQKTFHASDIKDWIETAFKRADHLQSLVALQKKVTPDDYQELLNLLSLTVLLAPQIKRPNYFFFRDHIYPREWAITMKRHNQNPDQAIQEALKELIFYMGS